MNVDIRKSNVELECNWCHKPILPNSYRLLWSRKHGAFTNRYYYHCEPDCWMEERIYYADQRRSEAAEPGRPRTRTREEKRENDLASKRKWWKENRGKK